MVNAVIVHLTQELKEMVSVKLIDAPMNRLSLIMVPAQIVRLERCQAQTRRNVLREVEELWIAIEVKLRALMLLETNHVRRAHEKLFQIAQKEDVFPVVQLDILQKDHQHLLDHQLDPL